MGFLTKRNVILLSIVILFLRIALLAFIPHPMPSDGRQFELLGHNLAQGKGFSIEEGKPYHGIRTFGYPLFIAAQYLIFGRGITIIAVSQQILDAITALVVYLILKRVYNNRNLAYVGAIFWLLNPIGYYYSQSIYTETLKTTLLVMTVYFFMKIKDSTRFFIHFSISMGFLSLIKETYLFFYFFLTASMLYLSYNKTGLSWNTRDIKQFLIGLACFLFLANIYGIYNYNRFGFFLNNYTAFTTAFLEGNSHLMDNYMDYQNIGYRHNLTDAMGNYERSEKTNMIIRSWIIDHPLTLLREVPKRFIVQTFWSFPSQAVFTLSKETSEATYTYPLKAFKEGVPLKFNMFQWVYVIVTTIAWTFILIFFLKALWLLRGERHFALFTSSLFVMLIGIHSIMVPLPRYLVVTFPFILISILIYLKDTKIVAQPS